MLRAPISAPYSLGSGTGVSSGRRDTVGTGRGGGQRGSQRRGRRVLMQPMQIGLVSCLETPGLRQERSDSEVLNDRPNVVTSGFEASGQFGRISRRFVPQQGQPLQIRRKFQPVNFRMDEQCTMTPKLSHE